MKSKAGTAAAPAPGAVKVTCSGTELVELDALVPFQDALKALSPAHFVKLQNSILKYGVTFPFFIWRRGRQLLVLDGHQREIVLKQMREEGFTVPKLPAVSIAAATEREAKEKILLLSSQYGEITEASLNDYLAAAGIDLNDIIGTVAIPNIDIESLVRGIQNEGTAATLAERFIIPPFSVLDARQGYWQDRKRAWLSLGIQSELGRGAGLLKFSEQATIGVGGKKAPPKSYQNQKK